MSRQLFVKLIIPYVIISSIFVGVVLNFLSFFKPGIVDNVGSWFITPIRFSDLVAITFIIFTFILLTTIKFIDKIASDTILIICVILTGFSLIYTSFSWNWQIYFINFLITGVGFGLIFPIFMTLIIRVLPSDLSKTPYFVFFLLTILIWTITFGIIFMLIGARFWRLLYVIVGTINIFSSIFIIKLKDTREIK